MPRRRPLTPGALAILSRQAPHVLPRLSDTRSLGEKRDAVLEQLERERQGYRTAPAPSGFTER